MTAHPIAESLNQLSAQLNAAFVEREDLTKASALALLTREHVFALGAPGSAKSQFFRTLAAAFTNARYFEIALSKTRPAEAVKGPLDIPAFREKGDYRYKRKGFATDSELIMLDEIGKASPVLGHDLLALLNERIGHEVDDEGNSVFQTPLATAFTASNEMLTDDSDDNAAIWDRLLFRVLVDYIKDVDNWKAMLLGGEPEVDVKIDWAEFDDVTRNVVPGIKVADSTLEALAGLKDAFEREGLSVSDRRWKASIKGLRANAFLEGRTETEDADIEVLQYTLWETPQQIEKVARLCKAASNPFYEPVMNLRDMLAQLAQGMDERATATRENRSDYAVEVTRKLRTARDTLISIEMEAGRVPSDVTMAHNEIKALMRRNLLEMVEQDADGIEETMNDLLNGSGI